MVQDIGLCGNEPVQEIDHIGKCIIARVCKVTAGFARRNEGCRVSDALVSVIIPVYNVEPYLCEALDSVIRQTYSNLEIIVIDDGSVDGSGRICDEYAEKDQRICVIHQENKGLSNARNAGLDRMTGEMVAMLDPDDKYDITFIEELKSAMDREQADLALGKYTVHYTIGKMNRRKKDIPEPSVQAGIYDRIGILSALTDGLVNVAVWNKLYRRELWKEIRFPDGHVCEDQEVAYRIINQCKKTVVVDLPLYYHRKRPGSITANLSWTFLCDQMLAKSKVEEFVTENLSDVLPEDSVLKTRQTCLNAMMIAYTRLFKVREKIDKKTESEELRQRIIRTGKKIGIRNCKIKTKAAYQMIRFCPWLLRLAYPVYLPVRLFVHKLTGK